MATKFLITCPWCGQSFEKEIASDRNSEAVHTRKKCGKGGIKVKIRDGRVASISKAVGYR